MNILQPKLIWVEGRCYRFCNKSAWTHARELGSYEEESYEPDYESNDEELCDKPIEIVPCKGNRYKHSFFVNSIFYKFIIGFKGATLKRLITDTKTFIFIPKAGYVGDIVITGDNQRDVMAARNRIDILIETSKSKLSFTHFISIPVISSEIAQNFLKFKEDVLRVNGYRTIKEEMFTRTQQLHLTLTMLVLLDEKDRKKAEEALEACKNQIIVPALNKNGPVVITFKGVTCMNDDPGEVDVLYIQVHDKMGCLQKISDDIADYFINQGLSRRQTDKVKLHLTAINTTFFVDKSKFKQQNRVKHTFNATEIIKKYQNYYFGKINLSTIHISQRFAKSKHCYFETSAKIEF